ncbi:hypothetical protein BDV27DRAFT_124138 [Aspergillus caelatus]|uniref:Uncharacterized protein n=1 Tax=Aspergillus caelatus TaxID=61420 RepID=A0A5N7AF83_9EURO|nr:uncharacterized protein BDV27DRAFT_124138 [Aspergillus caelatus]KAE8367310.1 hypothetical protein BDV27DRAFT_124138 [Aspergillus caelatus]
MIHLHFKQNQQRPPESSREGKKILICSWITLVILTTVGDSRYGVPWIWEFCSTNLIDSPHCVRANLRTDHYRVS